VDAPYRQQCRQEEGTELFRIRAIERPLNMNVNPQFSLAIAFAEPEIVEGQAIVPTLDQLAGEVDGVVKAFTLAGLLN
jgi:hypothetical protein